jgi:hypothetical protein
MFTRKFLILCIKGFGDAVISCGFANRLNIGEYVFITSKKNESLVRCLLQPGSKVFVINWLDKTFELFSLSSLRFDTLLRFINLRIIIKYFSSAGFVPLIDVNNIRNKILYFSLSANYPKIHNVYDHYSSLLNQSFYVPKKSFGQILIFPFGSHPERCMSEVLISSICEKLISNNSKYRVVLHFSEKEKFKNDNYEIIYYETVNQLISFLDNASSIITVDSFSLHIAIFMNKEIIVITNSYDLFIHPYLIKNERILPLDNIDITTKKILKLLRY